MRKTIKKLKLSFVVFYFINVKLKIISKTIDVLQKITEHLNRSTQITYSKGMGYCLRLNELKEHNERD